MGLFDLFKKPVPPAPPRDATAIAPKNTAKVSYEPLQFNEGKPYLALIGHTFDVWGVVDVIGDTHSHIAVKDVPAAILKRNRMANFDGIAAFERKLILAHTKGFDELPREEAFDVINTLGENLMTYVGEMKERLDDAARDEDDDPKWLRETLRDTKKEFTEYWAEDLNRFRSEVLPQALADYYERPAVASSLQVTPTLNEDDDYGAFVESMWAQAEIALPELAAEIDNERCFIVSLASRHGGSVHVNAWVAGEKKTFVADRHHWRFGDAEIDASAFVGVMRGAPVEIAFSADPHPNTVEEARRKDRFETKDRRQALCYEDGKGTVSWRVISRIWRGSDHLTARCHFRWGERRTFLHIGIIELIDLETGEIVPFEKSGKNR